MSYVVQATPYSKIFMPEWEQKCVEDPTLIGESKRGLFEVRIPRSCGGLRLKHLMPVHAATLVVRGTGRKIEDDEVTPLVEWLTSERSEETHIWGVVAVDIGQNFENAMQEMMHLAMESAQGGDTVSLQKKQATLQNSISKDLVEQLAKARQIADARVKHALSITHSNLLKSWEALKSEGKGTYAPSVQEALGHFIIKAEVDRKLELNRKLYNTVADGIPGAQRI